MKVKPKTYARALADVKKFSIGKFLRLLEKNGDGKKLKQIIIYLEKIVLAKSGNKKITLETARPLVKKIKVGKRGDMVEKKINSDLVAGMRIIIDGERQLDFSLKKKLDEIFH